MLIQTIILWTHAKSLAMESSSHEFKKIILNIIEIAIFIGFAMFIRQIILPTASAPTASTITNFAQIFDKDPAYSSIINVLSVIFYLVKMPLIIMFYQII